MQRAYDVEDKYVPPGIDTCIDQRLHAPEKARPLWRCGGETIDAIATRTSGALIVLDAPFCDMGRYPFIQNVYRDDGTHLGSDEHFWEEFEADKERSLYLDLSTIYDDTGDKGFVKKNGKLVPDSKTVARVWEFLNRGKNVQEYAEEVYEASSLALNRPSVWNKDGQIMSLIQLFPNRATSNLYGEDYNVSIVKYRWHGIVLGSFENRSNLSHTMFNRDGRIELKAFVGAPSETVEQRTVENNRRGG